MARHSRTSQAARLVLMAGFAFFLPHPGSAQSPIQSWQVAGPYPLEQVSRDAYPNFYALFMAPWADIPSGEGGALVLGERLAREFPDGDLALMRHSFISPQDGIVEIALEYAEEIDLFFNGWRVFSGRRPHPHPDVTGGRFSPGADRVPLFAKKGMNEILIMVSSAGDEWGLRAGTDQELHPVPADHGAMEEVWITPDTFLTPESVLKDPNRDLLYVTSFDNQFGAKPEPSGYISRLGLDGEILDHRWVEDLHAPTGMDTWRDTLFVAERENLLAIDLATGEVAGRWPIPDPVFPNDLVIDGEGVIYISDTRTDDWSDSRIYRFRDGRFDIFANEGISRANGLWIHDGWLVVGSSGDGFLKKVELATGRIETITSFGAGIIDGIRWDPEGAYLVSRWEGQLFRISPTGEVLELLDARPQGWNTADFEYLPEEKLFIFPTFLDNRVRAMRMGR